MLEVQNSGGGSVKIATKSSALWVNPASRLGSDKMSELKNAVQIATEPQLLQDPVGDAAQLEGPGEYEAGHFALLGLAASHYAREGEKVTHYRLEVAGFSVGVLGNSNTDLDEQQLESLGLIDVLIMPVADGIVGPSPHEVTQLVRRIEPKVLIPTGVAIEDTSQEPTSLALADLVKELGANTETSSRLKLKTQGDIPAALTVYLPE